MRRHSQHLRLQAGFYASAIDVGVIEFLSARRRVCIPWPDTVTTAVRLAPRQPLASAVWPAVMLCNPNIVSLHAGM
jgi:hypothetical protein